MIITGRLKNDTLLPAGRLREGTAQMRRANVIVFTKCPNEVTPIMRRILQKDVGLKPYQSLFFTTHWNMKKFNLFLTVRDLIRNFMAKRSYSLLVLTGIAYPNLIHPHLKQFAKK